MGLPCDAAVLSQPPWGTLPRGRRVCGPHGGKGGGSTRLRRAERGLRVPAAALRAPSSALWFSCPLSPMRNGRAAEAARVSLRARVPARGRVCARARACGARAAICAPVRRTINICPDLTPLHGRADNLLEEQKRHWDRQPPAGAQGSGGQARRGRGAPGTRGLTGVRARPSGRCRPAVPQPPSLAARSAASSRSHARHSWLA